MDVIADTAELRSLYRQPGQAARDKSIDHIDAGAKEFIARSPLVIVASGDGRHNDASPRGGPPGFVRVLDDGRLAFGDLVGNNRLDSYANLVAHPGVGLLFVIPGLLETLRVNGRAAISTDEALRQACALDDRVPRAVVVVEVEECFVHCGAALRRAGLWDVATWPDPASRPSAAAILKTHTGVDASVAEIEADLDDYYEHHVWHVGGAEE